MKKAALWIIAVLLLGSVETGTELGIGESASLGEFTVELVDLSGSTAAFAFYENGQKIAGFELVETGNTIMVGGVYLTLKSVSNQRAVIRLSDEAPASSTRFLIGEAEEFFSEHYSEYGEARVKEARFNHGDALVVYAHETVALPAVTAVINGVQVELPESTIQKAAAIFFDVETGEVLAEYTVN